MPVGKKAIILFVLCQLFFNVSYAKSLGTFGATFPIVEPDLLQVIQTQVALLKQQGKLETWQTELNQDVERAMDRPPPVIGLSRAVKSNTWVFDPSVPLSLLSGGELGRINPLESTPLKEALLFYDADDQHQVAWAEQVDTLLRGKSQLILVGGSVKSQEKRFHKPVYFDQGGRLTDRFQLHHVPTLITQQDHYLKIQEVCLP